MSQPVNTATAITAVASRAGTLKAGDTVTFTVTTQSAPTVTGTPKLTLSNGSSAAYSGTDANGKLVFTYTVATGQDAANLTVTGLDLNGGSLDKAGTLGFAAPTSVGAGAYSLSVAAADIDKDGDIDLLVANAGNNNVAVRLNDGTGNFGASTFVGVGNDPQNVTVADMNGDGFLDLLTANKGSSTVSVRLGDGKGGFAGSTEVGVGVGTLGVTTADVNGDGRLDILAVRFNPSASSDRSVSVRLNDGQGGFSGNTEVSVGTNPRSVTTADVNGDGILDILTANQGASSVSVALGNGQGGVSSTTNYGMGSQPYSVAAADLNGDGRIDLITANNNGNVSVRLANGSGGFAPLTQVGVGSGSLALAVADVNGDSRLDILTANYNDSTVSVRLGDGKGGFSGTTNLAVGTHPLDVKAADVNGDGRLDIIAANADSGTVSVILNTSIVPVTFDGASVSRTTSGAATGLAIDATAPALTGTQTALTGTEDTATSLTTAQLLDGWTDTAGLTVTGVSVTHGTIVADNTGGYRITPDADYNGPLVVSYTVSDGTNPVAATRTVTLAAVNDAPSFNGPGTGKVLTPVGTGTSIDRGYSVFVQADGKIVVAGQGVGADNTADFAVVRYNRDGSLDTTFGTGGKILTPVGTGSDIGRSVFVQADGKIVVAGQGIGADGSNDFAVVRYTQDGSHDATFGTGGKILTPVGTSSDIGRSVFVQADGKIVVAGSSIAATGISEFAVVRYNSNGSFDTSFNSTGKVRTAFTGNPDTAYSVTVQADGKIVVAGSAGNRDFAVLRYNTDGTLDTGFGAAKTGQITISDQNFDVGQSVLVQADGKIVVVGQSLTIFGNYVVRYNADGTLDTGFGVGGKVSSGGSFPYSAALQQDGKIVVAGYQNTSASDFTVTRYDVNGSLDTTFGTGGKVVTPVGPSTSTDIGYGVTVQADGKIVVAGSSSNVGNGTNLDFAVVRYNSDGSLDTTFNPQSSLGGTVAFTENDAAVQLDTDVALSDVDLDGLNGGLGDYAGATLTLARQGGANAQDAFGLAADGFTVSGNSLRDASGTVFATFTTTGGTLVVTFIGANVATSALADAVARAVTYANTSDAPPASVALAWTFSDGGADAKTTTGLTTVAITAANDAPSLTGTQAVLAAGTEDTAFTVSAAELLQGFTDPEGTALVLSGVAVDHGTISGNSASGYTITPTADYNGPLVISYRVGDGTLSTPASLTKTLAATNDAPRLTGTQATLAASTEDTAFTVTTAQLLRGFTDPDGTTPVVTNLTVDHGSIAEDGAGGYTITPADDYNGPITISYRVGDGTVSIPASLSTTLAAANDAPVLVQPASVTIAENAAPGTVIATLAATDVDDATAALRYAITDGNADGLFAIDAVTGAVTLAAGKHLDHEAATSHTLTIVATDPAGLPSATIGGPKGNALTIAVTDVNEATAITATASRAGTLTAGDTVTFTLATESAAAVAGTPKLTLSNGASASYAGTDGSGRLTFTYTVAAGQDSANLTVTGLDLDGGSLDKPPSLGFGDTTEVRVGTQPRGVTTADVNGDGFLDILTANERGNSVSVRLGDGAGGFSGTPNVGVGGSPWSVTVADVNRDGNLDILAANGSDTVSVRLGDGTGGFSGTTNVGVGSRASSVTVADVNGDGRLDILAANYFSDTVSVRLGDGAGGFGGTTNVGVGSRPQSVTVADVNKDGKLDILTANEAGNSVSVRLGDGAGGFGGATEIAVGGSPYSVTTADVNGDGRLDILVANSGSNTVSVRLGDGAGGFGGATNVAVGSTPTSVTAADVNGDGRLDILAANAGSNTVSVRLGDGAGGFGGATDVAVGSTPYSLRVADVNGDGKFDILTANYFSSTVSVRLNTSTFTTLSFDTASVSGTTPGGASGRAIDTVAPALTGTPVALAAGIEDTAYTVTKAQLLEGWADAGSATLTVTGLTASSGTVTAHADGSYTVTPAADANGPVTLSYRVGDGLNTVAASRGFTLAAVNDAPLAVIDAPDLLQRTAITGNLLANDTDVDGDTITITAVGAGFGSGTALGAGATTVDGKYGTLTLESDGTYTYAAGESLVKVGNTVTDTFSYTVSDGTVTSSATLVVTVTGSGVGNAGDNVFRLTGIGTSASGAAGNDTYFVDGATDQVIEAAGGGSDAVFTSVDYTLAGGQEIESLVANAGLTGLTLTGNAFANRLVSGGGADTLVGGAGNDSYFVNNATDQVIEAADGGRDTVLASVDYTLAGAQEIETLQANAGLTGLTLTGNELANTLISGGGADTLIGGGGNDSYFVNGATDQVREATDGGRDTVFASTDYALAGAQEIEILQAHAGLAGLTLTGNELANTLVSGGGADTLIGGGGNDNYFVNGAADQVREASDGGRDAIFASVDYTLAAGQEIETLLAHAGLVGLTLTGNELANTLISGAGADTLIGGGGGDNYFVDDATDQVIEAAGGGTDTVFASVDYALAGGQEIETLRANAGLTGLTLTGNAFANTLFSGGGADTLVGGAGNDVYFVNGAADQVIEAVGGGTDAVFTSVDYALAGGQEIESLVANAGLTGLTLTGNAFANRLVSGGGADILIGGRGDDSYFVNGAADRVQEAADGGRDTVFASTDYTLADAQEIEILQANAGLTSLTLTGNDLANTLISGGGTDTLIGGGGNDNYFVNGAADQVQEVAGGGRDAVFASVDYTLAAGQEIETLLAHAGLAGLTLTGNDLANTLISGAGADTLIGGGGSDNYFVDNAADQVIEAAGGGTDTVFASVDYALAAGQEVETLRANAGFAGLTLTGNAFANTLISGGGADTLVGGAGNDVYFVNGAADQVIEAVGGGTDAVFTSVDYTLVGGQEIESLMASAGPIGLTLTGNAFANRMVSGGGTDTLAGGAGDDSYFVNDAADGVREAADGGRDTVFASVDYTLAGAQEIEILQANAGLTGLTLTGNEGGQTIRGGAGTDIIDGQGGADTLQGFAGNDSFVFSTTLGRDNVDRIVDFTSGEDRIVLSAAIFDALPEGALSAAAFKDVVHGALDDTDRIVYDSRSGALSYDADGSGAKAAIQFAVIDTKVVLTHADLLVA